MFSNCFPFENVVAPTQRFDFKTARAWLGWTVLLEIRAVHGGILSTSISSATEVKISGPTSGSISSSGSCSSSSSSSSSSFCLFVLNHWVRPYNIRYESYHIRHIIWVTYDWHIYYDWLFMNFETWGRICSTWWTQLASEGSASSRTGIGSNSGFSMNSPLPPPSSSSSSSSSVV